MMAMHYIVKVHTSLQLAREPVNTLLIKDFIIFLSNSHVYSKKHVEFKGYFILTVLIDLNSLRLNAKWVILSITVRNLRVIYTTGSIHINTSYKKKLN